VIRERITYANVTATLALFVALGGSSYAALSITGRDVENRSLSGRDVKTGSLDSRVIRDRSIARRDLRPALVESLAGETGPPGADGTPGADGQRGATGARGSDGAPGSDAASLLSTRITMPDPAPTEQFGPVAGGGVVTTLPDAEQLTPNAPFVLRDLSVRIPAQNEHGGQYTGFDVHLMVDGAPTALHCRARGPSDRCDSGASTVTVPAGSRVALRISPVFVNDGPLAVVPKGGPVLAALRATGS
jgi:hypothetical protein